MVNTKLLKRRKKLLLKRRKKLKRKSKSKLLKREKKPLKRKRSHSKSSASIWRPKTLKKRRSMIPELDQRKRRGKTWKITI